jgi:hypothetical protein
LKRFEIDSLSSAKLVPFPADAIFIYSIVLVPFTGLPSPPEKNP